MPPLIEATVDDLSSQVESTPLPVSWFGAMLDGLVDERSLLAPLLCRVSPADTAVACACRGLLRLLWPRNAWHVRLEAGYPPKESTGRGRIDLLVQRSAGEKGPEWVFAWKPLWQRDFKEDIASIKKDLAISGGRQRGCVIAFAYEVGKAPEAHAKFVTNEPLDVTVRRATEVLGPPIRRSRNIAVRSDDVEGDFALLAWA